MIQRENDIFPIEVKSDINIKSKSLKKFKELFPEEVKLRIRYSLNNLKLDDDILNIPLFMIDQTDRLIEIALKEKRIDMKWQGRFPDRILLRGYHYYLADSVKDLKDL